MNTILIVVIGYTFGSIPFGYLLVRIFKGEDVRTSGSGNIGATNVARRSPLLGLATLALDAGKGLAAVLVVRSLFPGCYLPLSIAAGSAVLGHIFPIWLKFQGGKGVATGLGSFALVAPKSIVCIAGVFLLLVALFRFVSLGSVSAGAAFPLFAWALHEYSDPRQLVLYAFVAILIVWKHRDNLQRIMRGKEPKIGATGK